MKLIAILSGGIDSATAVAEAIYTGNHSTTSGVFFRYHQRNLAAESVAARHMATHFGIELKEISMPAYASAITDLDIEVPKDRSIEEIVPQDSFHVPEELPETFVPGRNLLMITLAAARAWDLDADGIVGGWHWDDSSGYPDCREAFLKAAERAVELALDRRVFLLRPLIELNKADIVRAAVRRGVPLKQTMSCYTPIRISGAYQTELRTPKATPNIEPLKYAHCGRCDACVLRKHAFEQAGIEDPTTYHKVP